MSQMLPEIFEAAGQEMAQGMEDGAGAFAKVIEDAAEKEDQCVGNELSTDAGAVKAIGAIGERAGQDTDDVSGVAGAAGSGVPGEAASGSAGTAVPAEAAVGEGPAAAAGENPQAAGRDLASLPTAGDPVDMATGDVVLGQADVALPGTLPLVVERAHRSSYRAGRWFGRSWVSTLDQRLEVTADGVFFARPDGSVLTYPHPARDGELVWPVSGARWPLARDGHGYTVSDPQAGTVRRFEPRSGSYLSPLDLGELPLVSVVSRAGHLITFEYDLDGAPVSITHDGGYLVKIEVTGGQVTGLVLAGAGADGEDLTLVRYGYDEGGNLAEVINSSAVPLRFSYDQVGRLTGWQDRNGWWYRYHYDAAGRCVRGEGPDGRLSAAFAYDPDMLAATHTDVAGAVTAYQLTAGCRVAAVTDPLGSITRSEYDQHGQIVSQTDPLGRTTSWSYDQAGNLTALTRADGSQATAAYGDQNLPVVLAEPGGARWEQEFDARGNLVRLTGPDASATRYDYDERGHLAAITDPLEAVTVVECNRAGLPVAVTAPDDAVTRYDRDGFGRVTAVSAPDGLVTRLAWTTEGQLASRASPDGTAEQYTYDGEGNLTARLDAAGAVTRLEYGCFDKIIAQTGPDGTRTDFSYDHMLRLTSVAHAGLTWAYEYDQAGRLVAQADYNGATSRYAHDAAGQITGRVNAAGQQVSYHFDSLGNMTERRADGLITTFGYDPAGRLSRAANPDAVIELERDAAGRVTAETCNGRTVRSAYDTAGQRVRRVTPSGAETRWDYDVAGRPVAVSAAGHELRFGYDPSGRETLRELPGGATLAQEWNQAGQLAAQVLTAASGTGQVLQRRDYSYRADGLLTGIDDLLSGPRRLTLNRAGRVTAVTGPSWAESYGYDRAGNITTADWPASLGALSVSGPAGASGPGDGAGPVASPDAAVAQGPREYSGTLIARAGDIRYEHDAAGRIKLRQHARLSRKPDTWRYEWDPDDRLTTVITPDGTRWRYVYDPFGRRIAKQRLGSAGHVGEHTSFTWDGLAVAEQATADSAGTAPGHVTTWDYKPGTFTPLIQAERWLRAPQDEVDQQFYAIVTDLIGTPAELVSPGAGLAGHQQHSLWGTTYWSGVSSPLRFPGQYADDETGLHYNHYRYYDPATGRYLSPDPLGLIPAPNPHAYVDNSCVAADPVGLLSVCLQGIEDLKANADAVHGALAPDKIALKMRTAAVVRALTKSGDVVDVYAGSGKVGLNNVQAAVVKNLDGIVAPNTADDAEMTAMNYVQDQGWTPLAGAVSRPSCPFCSNSLLDSGATMIGPLEDYRFEGLWIKSQTRFIWGSS